MTEITERELSEGALNRDDTMTVLDAVAHAKSDGRIVEAIEVHPSRRIAAGPWLLRGIPIISNGLLSPNKFTLKLRGITFLYDDRDEIF